MNSIFDVFPRVFTLGENGVIHIKPLVDIKWLKTDQKLYIHTLAKNDHSDQKDIDCIFKDGEIVIEFLFETEGEFLFDICCKGDRKPLEVIHLFAIKPDMSGKRPYKGDFHIHTYRSDGNSSPIHMAVTGKGKGMDFAAITDHDTYEPSLEAIKAAEHIKLDMLLFPGEEVELVKDEDNGHILSIDACDCVSVLRKDRASWKAECQEIVEKALKERSLVRGMTKEKYADALWTINTIKKLKGFSILAHPYWEGFDSGGFYMEPALYYQLLKDDACDAIELVGAGKATTRMLSVAKYMEECSNGKISPVVSNSDAHSDKGSFGRNWTMVFSDSLEKQNILAAVAERKAVACEISDQGEFRCYGPFDLVEYALFLHREVLPVHDEIAALQASFYMKKLQGYVQYDATLGELKNELDYFYRKYWAIRS